MDEHKAKMTREEKSWILYDWANSVYATIMMAAVFPIYFSSTAGAAGQSGDYWWGIGTSVATAVVAILAPFIGALADFKGYKKKLFSLYLIIGLAFTLLSAVSDNWVLLLLGYILSHIGFSGSCLLYDSFLTDVTTPERMDKISGYGYAFGYIGGSTIPFLASIALIAFGENFGIGTSLAFKISVAIAVVWWGLFSIPFLKNVQQKYSVEKPKTATLKHAFAAVLQTAKKIFQNKSIFFFILAYFFYIDGVGTVISMSTSYGATLGLDSTGMILALLVTQIVAFPCSILFSTLSRKFGSLTMLRNAVYLYLVICIVGFVMGFGLEEGFFGTDVALVLFWILAGLVGTVQGGIQAISRSYYGKLVPPENSGEYFGFFDIFGKFAAVLGPALYALTKTRTGRSSLSILSIIPLFLIALVILIAGRKHLVK
ncbi:MAG: MFS transporter [Oscillospiraceae bacterium]